MKQYTTLLFDFNGTLAYSNYESSAVNEKHAFFSLKSTTISKIHEIAGRFFVGFYKRLVGSNEEKAVRMHEYFKKNQSKRLHPYSLYPGVAQTLDACKQNRLALGIVTAANRQKVDELLHYLKLTHFFSVVITADDVKNNKPHPEPFEKAMTLLAASKEHTLMIGDTEADIIGARNAGIDSVGVAYGSIGEDILAHQPTYLIHSLPRLLDIVIQNR
jgi:HAD superfamily hydrolase (TIGR01509 family)